MARRKQDDFESGLEEILAGFMAAMDAESAGELFAEYEEETQGFEETDYRDTDDFLEHELNESDVDELEEEGKYD